MGSTRPRHVAVKVDVPTRERNPYEPGKFTHQHFFEIFSQVSFILIIDNKFSEPGKLGSQGKMFELTGLK